MRADLKSVGSRFESEVGYQNYNMKYSDDQIFKENSDCDDKTVKSRYLNKIGIENYKCTCCGISNWQDEELVLQLDHINGVHTDNRWPNLRLLCPNCHSQTSTFSGKNLWQAVHVTDEELIEAINSSNGNNEALKKVKLDVGRTAHHARIKTLIDSGQAEFMKTTFNTFF